MKTKTRSNLTLTKSSITLTVAMGCGLFNLAYAGDPNVASVKGEAKPGILANRINVSNDGSAYTATLENTAPMRVGGLVMCKKKSEYDGAYWVYGNASTAGDEFNPSNTDWYVKTGEGVAHGIDKKNPIIEGASPYTMQIPIQVLNSLPGSGHLDAVKICNARLAQHVASGGSKYEFLQNDQYVTETRKFSLVGRCRYDGVGHLKGYDHHSFNGNFTVVCKGNPDAKPPTPGSNEPQTLKQPYRVRSVNLNASPALQTVECPATVKFNGNINVNEAGGKIKYRMIGAKGFASPVYEKTLAANSQTLKVNFSIEVGKETNGFDLKGSNQNNGKSINQLKGTPPNSLNGWYAIKVLSPSKIESPKAHYQVNCKKALSGPATLTAPKPAGNPEKLSTGLQILKVQVSAPTNTHNGMCPADMYFNGLISAKGKGQIKYQWVSSNGYKSSVRTMQYNNESAKQFSHKVRFNKPEQGQLTLKIVGINGKKASLNYEVKCKSQLKAPEPKEMEGGFKLAPKPKPKPAAIKLKIKQ